MSNEMKLADLPQVKTTPVIEYSKLQEFGELIKKEIESFGIDEIEANEDNLSLLKKTRASLNNRFKDFEDRRKFIKDTILKPYNDFDESYKKFISLPFSEAEKTLKSRVQTVESEILNEKIDDLKVYFEVKNNYEFVKFEHLELKITRSASDKSIKESIDAKLSQIESDLSTINTLDDKDRVLAQYQMNLDLNKSISSVNIAIERERQIEQEKKEREDRLSQQRQQVREEVIIPADPIDETIYTASFKVFANKHQLKELKQFMENKGIRYE